MESRKPSLFNQLEPHNEDSDSTDISDISEDEDWEDDPPLSPKSQPLEFPKLDHDVPLPRPPSLLSCLLYNNGNNNNNSNNHTNTLHPSNNILMGAITTMFINLDYFAHLQHLQHYQHYIHH